MLLASVLNADDIFPTQDNGPDTDIPTKGEVSDETLQSTEVGSLSSRDGEASDNSTVTEEVLPGMFMSMACGLPKGGLKSIFASMKCSLFIKSIEYAVQFVQAGIAVRAVGWQ